MKLSDYVAQRLAFLGVSECFAVTGGGAMHLNDSFGECKEISCWYMHHEQAASIAAEGYARISGKPAVVNVTSGPGAINSFNGIFGAYTDSIPMLIVVGQVRTDTISNLSNQQGLRQLGDQEVRSIDMVKQITKSQFLVTEPNQIVEVIDRAYFEAISGRPGPVWVEIPVNIQGQDVIANPKADKNLSTQSSAPILKSDVDYILEKISSSHRPLIMAGTGVRLSGTPNEMLHFADITNTPVVTAWTHDLIPTDHKLFAGRPGTIGTRPGNFAVQNCDLLIVLGSRLNIRQVSYNWDSFAKNAEIIWIEIDPAEFSKQYLQRDSIYKVVADLREMLPALISGAKDAIFDHSAWVAWCHDIRIKYELNESSYKSKSDGINPYHLVPEVFRVARDDSNFVCGNATACIVPFQTALIKPGMRMFSNSGSASMGYDLPAAIGAAIADTSRKTICFAGDGSLMMNIQELETLSNSGLDVLVVVLDNDGYLSIKQTQENFFGHDHGASSKSGVTFPDFVKVAQAFGIESRKLDPAGDWKGQLREIVGKFGPRLVVAPLEISQEFIPRLKSKMIDGTIVTPELDDMFPHLPESELDSIRIAANSI
jgi:acetolactate synthase-1/2/3 large subunit